MTPPGLILITDEEKLLPEFTWENGRHLEKAFHRERRPSPALTGVQFVPAQQITKSIQGI